MPTLRHFVSWGPHRKRGDAALRDTLMAIAGKAFAEDRTIIETATEHGCKAGPCGANKTLTVRNPL
jgi:hypothetical protein